MNEETEKTNQEQSLNELDTANTNSESNDNSNSGEMNDLQINNLPNRLTILRLLIIPFVLASYSLSKTRWIDEGDQVTFAWVATLLFFIASVTDFFDGYIARKRKIVTVFGSFLDPIADKFLTVSLLILLGSYDEIPVWIVIILVLREMYMTSLRLLAMGEGIKVPVVSMGKWKTATQMAGIPLIMSQYEISSFSFETIGLILIVFSTILSLWSSVIYTLSMVKKMKIHRVLKRIRRRKKLNKKQTDGQE